MIVVADSSVLIDLLRHRPEATRLFLEIAESDDDLWSATIVRTEVLTGMRPMEKLATMQLLGQIRWKDVTCEVADRAGELARLYFRSHRGIDALDYITAAATQILGGRLLTRNVKHFPMFAGLKPAY